MRPGRFGGLAGIAAAEFRSARRMARTWLFALLALAVGAISYHGFSMGHFFSDGVAPRFALPGLGLLLLWIVLAGVVFISFDARARDERARLVEALDARPVSNGALLGGRLLATAIIAWLPLALLPAGLWASGALGAWMQAPVGPMPEPVSLLTFLLLDAPVALIVWGALVALLVALLRVAWVAAAVALALLGCALWAVFNTPLYLLPAVAGVTHLGLAGSEMLPRWPAAVDVLARGATLVLAAGLLALAAALGRRADGVPRRRYLALGGGLAALGALAIGALAWEAQNAHDERLAWAQTHRALAGQARLDIERLSGQVVIEPGRRLAIRVDVAARAPRDAALPALRFSLNPGLTVTAVQVDGTVLPHDHEQGLLTIGLDDPLGPGRVVTVAVAAQGVPDPRFGYLDSATDAMAETLLGSPMVLLGEQASLFDARYVALPPAVRWLPAAGANFAAPPDFHALALDVELPAGWHAAGAGKVPDAAGARFAPRVPISEFALLAAPLQRRAMTVSGVVCELLIHAEHTGNVDYFAASTKKAPSGEDALSGEDGPAESVADEEDEASAAPAGRMIVVNYSTGEDDGRRLELGGGDMADQLRAQLRRWLSGEHAPAYPHDVVSLVEVPAQLRRYGGGWLMDSLQGLPGVQLLPEHGFPTSRLTERPRLEGFPEERWLDYLFAQIDYAGPHGVAHTVGAARNLLPFVTRATGEGAAAADYLLEWLTEWRVRGIREVAPAQWLSVGTWREAPFLVRAIERAMAQATMASRWHLFFPMALEDASARVSFAGFDPAATPDGTDILIHKGNLIALSIRQLLGAEGTTRFLGLMRERHGGHTFTLDDLTRALIDVEPALAEFLTHILHETTLPGFVVSDASVARLPDDAAGNPRYQTRVHVRNDAPAPGVAGISYRMADLGSFYQWSPFTPVPGEHSVEIGVVSRAPPAEVRLETYLSQNRRILRLRLPPVDAATVVDAPALIGARPSDWRPPHLGIVVDDLDPGFSTVSPRPGWRLADAGASDGDGGSLPEFGRDTSTAARWRRQADENAVIWGKYRRTLARIAAGDGEGRAVFRAELPSEGRWRLYYHLPGASVSHGHYLRDNEWWGQADSFGDMDIRIVGADADNAVEVAFDGAEATPGWNSLGIHERAAGPVDVIISDRTTGDIVVADAIRWERVEGA